MVTQISQASTQQLGTVRVCSPAWVCKSLLGSISNLRLERGTGVWGEPGGEPLDAGSTGGGERGVLFGHEQGVL